MSKETPVAEVAVGTITVEVESKKSGRKASVEKYFGADLAEAEKLFGAEVVFSLFRSAAVIKCQAAMRSKLDAVTKEGEAVKWEAEGVGFANSIEDAVAAGLEYRPAAVTEKTKTSAIDKLVAQVEAGKMSKEELIAQLQAKLGI